MAIYAMSWNSILETVVPAVVSGGGTAVSAFAAFFRETRKRVEKLEERLGSIEAKAGVTYSIHLVETALQDLRERLDSQVKETPRWRMPSYSGIEVDDRLREFERRLKDLESNYERMEKQVRKFITEDDFEEADRQRAAEIAGVKNTLAEIRGLLQGLQSALGLLKPHR